MRTGVYRRHRTLTLSTITPLQHPLSSSKCKTFRTETHGLLLQHVDHPVDINAKRPALLSLALTTADFTNVAFDKLWKDLCCLETFMEPLCLYCHTIVNVIPLYTCKRCQMCD